MVLTRKRRRMPLGLAPVLGISAAVASVFLIQTAIAATNPLALFPGTWAADEASQFDPFTLITRPVSKVRIADAGDGSTEPAVEGEPSDSSPGLPAALLVPYVPPPRIPYRPPLRSPYQPPI